MNASLIVWTTCDERQVLEQIASQLIQSRQAACCQISGPMTSYFRWEGKTEQSQEWLCSIKTTAEAYAAVEETISKGHSYDEPEIIAAPITHGSATYLKWLEDEVTAGG